MARKAIAVKPTVRLYLADDFRPEIDGKITAVGLYTDLVVVANLPADAPPISVESPLSIHSLSALVTISGLEGDHLIGFEYSDPTAGDTSTQGGEPKVLSFPGRDRAANLMIKFQPFRAGGFGSKQVVVTVDGERLELVFELRKGEPASPQNEVATGLKTATEATKPLPRTKRKTLTPSRRSTR